MHNMLRKTELTHWWCSAIDRLIGSSSFWTPGRAKKLAALVANLEQVDLLPWGKVQQFDMPHLAFGGLPSVFGFDEGTQSLGGSIGTICQGAVIPAMDGEVVIGPAYRMICDFSDDGILTALPGGIHGSRFSKTYKKWLKQWRQGEYHRLEPPMRN